MSEEYQRSVDGETWVDCSEVEHETAANTGFRFHRKRRAGDGDRWWYTTNFGTPEPYEVRKAALLAGLQALYQRTGLYLSGFCQCGGYMGAEDGIEVMDATSRNASALELSGAYEAGDDVIEFVTKEEQIEREKRRIAAAKRKAKREQKKNGERSGAT